MYLVFCVFISRPTSLLASSVSENLNIKNIQICNFMCYSVWVGTLSHPESRTLIEDVLSTSNSHSKGKR